MEGRTLVIPDTCLGTYIKEFVHGDFGRTVPSFGSLVGCAADILTLDVEEVHLEWPPKDTTATLEVKEDKTMDDSV